MTINNPQEMLRQVVEETARRLVEQRRVPCATYRLQFSEQFTFRDAQAVVPYLADLGISDLYASPLFRARPGSTHGYDICDYGQFNPALGTPEDFDALVATLQAHGQGLMLDMVPNHMGIGQECNTWWMDVLENGPSSVYAPFFDIDWHPVKLELANKVLLPILEDQYGSVLEGGKFRLAVENGALFLYYGTMKLPVALDTYADVLSYPVEELVEALGADDEQVMELQSILTALSYLPAYQETDPDKIAERHREKEIIKRRIAALLAASPDIQAALDRALEAFNGVVGDPASFDRLEALLNQQPYRPASWRVAADEINYRRFFDINDMAAIKVEEPQVFAAVHQFLMQLLVDGRATSLRVDHPDGLWDPVAYFGQLQQSYVREHVQRRLAGNGEDQLDPAEIDQAVRDWFAGVQAQTDAPHHRWPLYIVAEKILSETEPLPRNWAVDGTTGYDFLDAVNGILVDQAHAADFDALYGRFLGHPLRFEEVIRGTKQMIMEDALASEIRSISHRLERITEVNRRYRDFTLSGLTGAIREVIGSLSIYRTYITDPETITERDQYYLLAAVLEARRRYPGTSRLLFSFIRDTLLLQNLNSFSEEARPQVLNFVMRFQQMTGPIMAKSVEDTAFYIYNRLAALNEVGGQPETFGLSLAGFHEQNKERALYWPNAMLSTSTHDTKRSEDVRARIDVLSEIPQDWEAALWRWSEINAGFKTLVDGELAPDRNDEYLLYQTLIGAWPDDPPDSPAFGEFCDRIAAYMLKAANESKVHTSWINPDEDYSAALDSFVRQVLDAGANGRFLADFVPFQQRVAAFGRVNSLSQTLLKLVSPGVPDIYQGTELWDLSLVDPDNRRPVDYERRRALLADLRARLDQAGEDRLSLAEELVEQSADGRIKLYVVHSLLQFRSAHEALFSGDSYLPLDVTGSAQDRVCAFARADGQTHIIAVAPRLVAGLAANGDPAPLGESTWGDSRLWLPDLLPAGRYRNLFTGEVLTAGNGANGVTLPVAKILRHFPVALLELVSD